MAKVVIRGIGKVTVSRPIGSEILAFKNDPAIKPDTRYVSHGLDFRKDDLGPIQLDDFEEDDRAVSERRKSENHEYYERTQEEYEKYIKYRCSMRIDEKAHDVTLYTLVAFSYGLEGEILRNFKESVRARQLDFFKNHPKYPYASVNVSDLLPQPKRDKDELHISNVIPSFTVRKAYAIMSEALRTAKLIKAL